MPPKQEPEKVALTSAEVEVIADDTSSNDMENVITKEEVQQIGNISVKVESYKIGDFTVTKKQKVDEVDSKTKESLITIHDIGLHHGSFDEYFANTYNQQFYDKLIIYNIDIPGQEKGAETFSPQYSFPSLRELADKLIPVLSHFKLDTNLIGLGVGAGASILMLLAMQLDKVFVGIAVVDPSPKGPGFKEWGEERLASWHLEKKGFTESASKFLIWHLFGTKGNAKKAVDMEMIDTFIARIKENTNPHNLAKYVKAYMDRTDILKDLKEKLTCRVLIITSDYSPYKDHGELLHKNLKEAELVVGQDSINIFFEDPEKCGEALLLLMQGCGLVPTLRSRTASRGGPMHRTASMSEDEM